jgi:hypoxanthine phosphoribosyltransferase
MYNDLLTYNNLNIAVLTPKTTFYYCYIWRYKLSFYREKMSDNTDYLISWEELHRDARDLAQRLLDQHQNMLPWLGIIGIARGGLIPAAILARELNIRMMDTLCISSYDHDTQGNLEVLKSIEGDGEGFLLVDDLVDTGNTARVAKELLPKADFICLYAKPAGLSLADYFQREFPQDTWLHFPWDLKQDKSQLSYSDPLVNQHSVR